MTAHGFIPSPALETYNTNIIYSEAGACELIKARQKSLTYLVSRRRPGTCKSIEISGGLGNVHSSCLAATTSEPNLSVM